MYTSQYFLMNIFNNFTCRLQEMQTIAICDMRGEDTKTQIIFWEKLNDVMLHCGHGPTDFYGFMADEASANWKAIRHVFNNGQIMEVERDLACFIGQIVSTSIQQNMCSRVFKKNINKCVHNGVLQQQKKMQQLYLERLEVGGLQER